MPGYVRVEKQMRAIFFDMFKKMYPLWLAKSLAESHTQAHEQWIEATGYLRAKKDNINHARRLAILRMYSKCDDMERGELFKKVSGRPADPQTIIDEVVSVFRAVQEKLTMEELFGMLNIYEWGHNQISKAVEGALGDGVLIEIEGEERVYYSLPELSDVSSKLDSSGLTTEDPGDQ
jgi:hypothetical protein